MRYILPPCVTGVNDVVCVCGETVKSRVLLCGACLKRTSKRQGSNR